MSHSLKVVRMAAVCCAMTSCAAILRRNGDIFFRVNRSVLRLRLSIAILVSSLPGLRDGEHVTLSLGGHLFRFLRFLPVRDVLLQQCAEPPAKEHLSPVASFASRPQLLYSPASGSFFFSTRLFGLLSSGEISPWNHRLSRRLRRFLLPDLQRLSLPGHQRFSATISVETFSVSRVKSASPAFTKSPDFLCQTETTPLEIDSPTAGILTSMLISVVQYAQSKRVVETERLDLYARAAFGRLGLALSF